MLVLTRKPGERVVIADEIRITISRVDRGSVRIGIEAPADRRIIRGESTVAPEARDAACSQTRRFG